MRNKTTIRFGFYFPWIVNTSFELMIGLLFAGPRVDNFQTLDPRKQELLEARFLGMRSSSNPAGGSTVSNNLPLPIANSTQSCNLMASQVQQPSPSSLNASPAVCAVPFTSTYSTPNNHGNVAIVFFSFSFLCYKDFYLLICWFAYFT